LVSVKEEERVASQIAEKEAMLMLERERVLRIDVEVCPRRYTAIASLMLPSS